MVIIKKTEKILLIFLLTSLFIATNADSQVPSTSIPYKTLIENLARPFKNLNPSGEIRAVIGPLLSEIFEGQAMIALLAKEALRDDLPCGTDINQYFLSYDSIRNNWLALNLGIPFEQSEWSPSLINKIKATQGSYTYYGMIVLDLTNTITSMFRALKDRYPDNDAVLRDVMLMVLNILGRYPMYSIKHAIENDEKIELKHFRYVALSIYTMAKVTKDAFRDAEVEGEMAKVLQARTEGRELIVEILFDIADHIQRDEQTSAIFRKQLQELNQEMITALSMLYSKIILNNRLISIDKNGLNTLIEVAVASWATLFEALEIIDSDQVDIALENPSLFLKKSSTGFSPGFGF